MKRIKFESDIRYSHECGIIMKYYYSLNHTERHVSVDHKIINDIFIPLHVIEARKNNMNRNMYRANWKNILYK